jgi:hypothetical protein
VITIDSCKYLQEAIFEEREELPDGTVNYRFKVPTLTPLADRCHGVSISKSALVNKNADAIILSRGYIADHNLVTIPYNADRFGEPEPGDSFVIGFLGGDPTRIVIMERR